MDDELEHSPRSWLDNFTQRFSWCRPSERASLFLNNFFLPGVIVFIWGSLMFNIYIFSLNRLDFITRNVEVIGYLLETLKDPYELLKGSVVLKIPRVGNFYKFHVEGIESLF